jgi:hypothetical protein
VPGKMGELRVEEVEGTRGAFQVSCTMEAILQLRPTRQARRCPSPRQQTTLSRMEERITAFISAVTCLARACQDLRHGIYFQAEQGGPCTPLLRRGKEEK